MTHLLHYSYTPVTTSRLICDTLYPMKVIVIVGKKAETRTRFMVELLNEDLIKEVRKLIKSKRHPDALTRVMSNGRFVQELSEQEVARARSDLIITHRNAYWTVV